MSLSESLRENLCSFFEYKTPKIVHIKSRKVGILNRLIQAVIISYIVGFILIYKKGYQEFSGVESSVTTKVKGVLSTRNLTQNDFNDNYIEDMDLYVRIWDTTDLVVPASENGAFFVTTNMILTPNQSLGVCPEDADVSDAVCDPNIKGFCDDKVFLLGHGIATGKCVNSTRKGVYTCEIDGWCPVEKDDYPLKDNKPLFTATKNFTVLIKNSIRFSDYNIRRRNIIEIDNSSKLRDCTYDPIMNAGCPVFVLNDIVRWADQDYDQISQYGGVIGIEINWDCNLDFDLKYCVPKYSFKRLDDPHTSIAKGWNFRYSNYYDNNRRTLYKATGIRFVLLVSGSAGKFNFIPLVIKLGSGLGLLAITTIICDIVVLYLNKGGKYYKDKKYQYVEQVNTQYTDMMAANLRQRTSSDDQRSNNFMDQ
ncbi:P2X purinoceptor 4-like [Oppia nitens]|uniref:P2X purinoceptor 4-like n=1 Tax=Oppia nitens TaxID=1686743 RepID=UPI0023D9CB45|nr:P2X purinoceptor 4-like [Oppia nitens]